MSKFDLSVNYDKEGIAKSVTLNNYKTLEVKENFQGKYFLAPNYYSGQTPNYTPAAFNYRIKDAIDTIKAGDGDELIKSDDNIYNSVAYYLNRAVGEQRRKSFLEFIDSANIEFEYYIIVNKFKYQHIGNCHGITMQKENVVRFNTEDAARERINLYYEKAIKIIENRSFESPTFPTQYMYATAFTCIEEDDCGRLRVNKNVFGIAQAIKRKGE
jgi:hypothetical protein